MYIKKQCFLLYSFSTARNNVNLTKNYYNILQIDIKCDQKSIKKSYLNLVKKLHPDVNPNGKQRFTEVQQAYQVLSDDQLKKYYDQNRGSTNTINNQSSHEPNSKKAQNKYGHKYYTHRTYQSQNYQDYYYSDNINPNKGKSNKKSQNKKDSDQQQDQQFQNAKFQAKRTKRTNTQQQWQNYRKSTQQRQQQTYKNQTEEQKKIRNRLKAMRGFTSSYNVMWNRAHLRYTELMDQKHKVNKNQEMIIKAMPTKVQKFYNKLMDTLEKYIDKPK